MKIIVTANKTLSYQMLMDALQAANWVPTEFLVGDNSLNSILEDYLDEEAITEYKINWEDISREGAVVKTGRYGKYNAHAGKFRNADMCGNADGLLAVMNGENRERDFLIMAARSNDCPVYEYHPEGKPEDKTGYRYVFGQVSA